MVIMDRQGIHIDYCTSCHGVYLDRGELDKLIQMASAQIAPQPVQQPYQQPPFQQQPVYTQPQQQYRRDYDDDDYHHHYKKKKRKGFLDDIFDFD